MRSVINRRPWTPSTSDALYGLPDAYDMTECSHHLGHFAEQAVLASICAHLWADVPRFWCIVTACWHCRNYTSIFLCYQWSGGIQRW
jgi:hypothetical protein